MSAGLGIAPCWELLRLVTGCYDVCGSVMLFFVGGSLELGQDVSDDDVVVVDDCISFETWNTDCGAWGSAVGICMLCHTGECISSNKGSGVVSQHWRS